MPKYDTSCGCVVIGAGVIGLACAAESSRKGIETVVLEAENLTYQHASSRNSEVIHSGIYYKQDSLKARFCLEGKQRLFNYCLKRGIDHKKIGKLVVLGKNESFSNLESLYDNAIENGVDEIEILDNKQLKKLEPQLKSRMALFSGSTGIIDSHALSLSLEEEIESLGGYILTNSPVINSAKENNSWILEIGGEDPYKIKSDLVINASGFDAINLGSNFGIKNLPRPYFILGHYYQYSGINPFNHLIYPLPSSHGLGIHTTLDLNGKIRFGPDVEIIQKPKYKFFDTPERRKLFNESIEKYFKDFQPELLTPDFTGIRVRLDPSHTIADFSILTPKDHGLDGLVNIAGIESPGLTSSLAIASYVVCSL